jgi:hypothetical protein
VTPTEVGILLTKISSVDNRRLSVATADAWTEILDPRITLADAWQAARDHFASKAGEYLMPGHINDRVKQMRKARLDAMRVPDPPEVLADDVRGALDWQRAYRSAIGDGHDEALADRIACTTVGVQRAQIEAATRPVLALVESVAVSSRIPGRAR